MGGSVVYNRFVEKAALIKRRQNSYGDRLCGKADGIPRALSNAGGRGNIVVPALAFFYIAGQIGWAGRTYLLKTRDQKKEILIDVPLAAQCMLSSFAFPVLAWQAIVNGNLTKADKDIKNSGHCYQYPG